MNFNEVLPERDNRTMTVMDQLNDPRPSFSLELWPPRTPQASARLSETIPQLAELKPTFVSITYGAGGSTRERTHELVVELAMTPGILPFAHLSCAAHSVAELREILARYLNAGVTNIVALRGDPPLASDLPLPDGELLFASQLVDLIRDCGPFTIAVAAHPEGHPQSKDSSEDLYHFCEKLDKADFAITQFFFRAETYFDFIDRVRKQHINKPILPGIIAPTSISSLLKMSELSGAEVPRELKDAFAGVSSDPASVRKVGVEAAINLARQLLEEGVPGIHVYSMNSMVSTVEIHEGIADLCSSDLEYPH